MPLYELTTISTFENVYVIDADTLDDAIQITMHEEFSPDFRQKHLGEKITNTIELSSGDPTEDDYDIADTRIRERGYV